MHSGSEEEKSRWAMPVCPVPANAWMHKTQPPLLGFPFPAAAPQMTGDADTHCLDGVSVGGPTGRQ